MRTVLCLAALVASSAPARAYTFDSDDFFVVFSSIVGNSIRILDSDMRTIKGGVGARNVGSFDIDPQGNIVWVHSGTINVADRNGRVSVIYMSNTWGGVTKVAPNGNYLTWGANGTIEITPAGEFVRTFSALRYTSSPIVVWIEAWR